ncbi:DEAD/DEAH box helicase, partial [Paracoccus sp. PAMC 22219]|uniref:DEAD/DEAH box helicase n=1 Tax=Paracoccus sp. PAMC 22219 TaxID=1569209 RepID=UPI0026F39C9B
FAAARDPRLSQALQAGADWAAAQEQAMTRFAPAAADLDPTPLRAGLARGVGSFFGRLFGPYRGSTAQLQALLVAPMPSAAADRLALVDELVALRRLRRLLAEDEAYLAATLGADWRGERTPFARLGAVAAWLAELDGCLPDGAAVVQALTDIPDPAARGDALAGAVQDARAALARVRDRLTLDPVAAGVAGDAPIADWQAALSGMADAPARYAEWADLARDAQTADRHGAGSVVEAVRAGRLAPQDAATEFAYACAEARWNAARQARPALNDLPKLDRHDLVGLFRQLEAERIEATKTLILSRHFDQLPRGTQGEMGLIRGEIARRRAHKPVRWLMRNAGAMVQRIKPVMLMSPISVAQFLPPDAVSFDLLVIDEASQIRPEDALGVIARARQIVVVGDQKQLPPTSFFDRLVDDAEDLDEPEDVPQGANVADMESILSLCEARGLRSRMLEWHYRSRDPSLIRVSNAEFYDDRLVLPPSPLQLDPDYGLKFRRVSAPMPYGAAGRGVRARTASRPRPWSPPWPTTPATGRACPWAWSRSPRRRPTC